MMSKKTVKIISIVIAVLLLLSVVVPALASTVYADSALDKLQAEYDKIVKEQKELKSEINKDTAEKKSAATKKSQIEREVNAMEKKISLMNSIISELSKTISQKEMEGQEVQEDLETHTEIYLQRIRENYEKGSVGALDVFFGSNSFSDMLTKLDNEQSIIMYDKSLMSNMRNTKNEIMDIKQSIENDKAKQEELKVEALADKKELEVKVKEQASLIKELETDLKSKQKMYNDLEAAEKKLDDEITKYLASLADSTFVGGNFIWPVPGFKRISSPFGYRTHPVTGKKASFHSGIDIPATGGSQILAANAGTVLKATYNSAYGNYVLIDHGGGYATMYAHARKLRVKVGDVVKQGERIGDVGTTGLSTGNHLHFEVRIKGVSKNALDYVKPK